MKKWLFNPFVYIAGSKALLIGWSIMLLTAIVSIFSHTHFDGVIDLHTARTATPVYLYFMEQLIDWGFVVVLCYIASLIFSRSSVRLVDIAGTVALSRAPMLLVSFIGFGMVPPVSDSVKVMVESITPSIIIFSFLSLICSIWMIALLYNAFTVATNIKGGKGIIVFITMLLIAETAAHIVLHNIYKHII
jgi:hypothetical protein